MECYLEGSKHGEKTVSVYVIAEWLNVCAFLFVRMYVIRNRDCSSVNKILHLMYEYLERV